MKRPLLPLVVFAMVLAAASQAQACSVPVFRYALERWPLAPYELLVFHQGPLSRAEEKLVDRLDDFLPPANVHVATVDLAGTLDPVLRKLWETHAANARLP